MNGGGDYDFLNGGNGNDTLNGGDGDDQLFGGSGDDMFNGGNGWDTVSFDDESGGVTVNLSTGTASGQGSDTLTEIEAIFGSGYSDNLTGDANSNYLDGHLGADTLKGGLGDDSYVVDNTGDIVTEQLNAGYDHVNSSITYTLTANVEALSLTGLDAIDGTGNGLANWLSGNSGNNKLIGGGGNDVLYGWDGNDVLGGGTGADQMLGGNGNDTYIVDDAGDTVVENTDEGTDTVNSSIAYVLTDNVENLTLAGALAINGTGNSLNNVIIGNGAANQLTGNGGNDSLDGKAGADTMIGGLGDDSYTIDDIGDVVTENPSEGTDTINSSITYTLVATLENLTLTGTATIDGTGNALANILTGNSGNNKLIGGGGDDTLYGGAGNDVLGGGVGADQMSGGLGNDNYVVDNTGDTVTENASEGTDSVNSSVTYTLTLNVENLTLTGTTAINGIGNDLTNSLIGNSASNQLIGYGGNDTLDGKAGSDSMTGGLGNDTYIVDNTGDTVTENLNEGTDAINSSVTYTLSVNVEYLTLTGTAAINGTGNDLANRLIGNSGNNQLSGGAGNDVIDGGAGTNTLTGDAGKDFFRFAAAGHIDTITDFVVVDDTIQLENAVFTSLVTTGTLTAGQFVIGSGALDSNDYVIYNSATGAILYDADGNGATAAVQIAIVTTGLSMTAADFVVI